jgi:phosphoribosylamine---glycine ligase
MRVLVVGSGAREHALAWAIGASPIVDALYAAPGNPGIAEEAECVPISAEDTKGLVRFARGERIDFVVVGPEAPLVLGLVDALEAEGVRTFGPSAAAAALEGSKAFAKDLCFRAGIPTASYRRFREASAAKAYIAEKGAPIVVKADGLAAGKGVTVACDLETAYDAVDAALIERRFGEAGAEIVVEEFLAGEEASFFALCDGENALPLIAARDKKRLEEGDKGPNTGGMGAYSPVPGFGAALEGRVMDAIVLPALRAMREAGCPFKGLLYAGLMLTEGGPKLLEFNVRFGDPETQVLMMRLKSDLLPALLAARDGLLKTFDLRWREEAAVCVVMAAAGYPDAPKKGGLIRGLDEAAADPAVKIFHAATRRESEHLLADGGRVLSVSARRASLDEARKSAYAAIDRIDWPDGFCRRDIGLGGEG